MKKTHIIAIVIIALAIGAIFTSLFDSSTYGSFKDAFADEGTYIQVVGQLNKEKEITYNPEVNADLLIFHMIDNDGTEKKVFLNQSKPQDFERSEEIVIKGKAKGEDFYATDMLMKCPSKYNEGGMEGVYTDEEEAK
jgi:cytochrome c-type biogenesis protein CcmE